MPTTAAAVLIATPDGGRRLKRENYFLYHGAEAPVKRIRWDKGTRSSCRHRVEASPSADRQPVDPAQEQRPGEDSDGDDSTLDLRSHQPADQTARPSGEGEDSERDSFPSGSPRPPSREKDHQVGEERCGDARDLGPVAVQR